MTRWLGEGREVLFGEFGLPTYRRGDPGEQSARRNSTPLVEEDAAAAYTAIAVESLRRAGCLGTMLWCYSDYDPALWKSPPLDLAPHERTFGLWRADGSPKASVAAVAAFIGVDVAPWHSPTRGSTSTGTSSGWIRVGSCGALYRRYRRLREYGNGLLRRVSRRGPRAVRRGRRR